MSGRFSGEEEMTSPVTTRTSVTDIDSSLSTFTKAIDRLNRMVVKIGTHADGHSFRDMLQTERKTATTLARGILAHIKENQIRGRQVQQFEREYKRFTAVIDQIDLKQKQQLVAVSKGRSDSSVMDEIIRDETASGRGNSFVQTQLPDEQNIQFLEYNVDEIQERHVQIRAIEHDILEMSEMWKDLQVLVNEQQVHIDVIEQNVIDTKNKVEEAHKDLEAAADYQTRARKKACCSAVLLIIILLVVVLVVLGVSGKL